MAVKIIIRRNVTKEARDEAYPLFLRLREGAMSQGGYISGETLRNFDDPDDHVVISTWRSIDDWKAWENSPQRKEIQTRLDTILGEKTAYNVYHYA